MTHGVELGKLDDLPLVKQLLQIRFVTCEREKGLRVRRQLQVAGALSTGTQLPLHSHRILSPDGQAHSACTTHLVVIFALLRTFETDAEVTRSLRGF